MIYSIQTGPNVFFQKLSPDKTVPSLELTKGGPPPAYLKTKPISNPLESDSDRLAFSECERQMVQNSFCRSLPHTLHARAGTHDGR